MYCGRSGLTLVNGEVNGVAETSWEARMSRYLHHIQPTMSRDSQLEYLLQFRRSRVILVPSRTYSPADGTDGMSG